jgi:hypothetical protein
LYGCVGRTLGAGDSNMRKWEGEAQQLVHLEARGKK